MKKRILSLLLALCLTFALLPTTALAVTTSVSKIVITMSELKVGQPLPTSATTSANANTEVTKLEWSGGNGNVAPGTDYTATFTVEIKRDKDAKFTTKTISATVNGESTGVKVERLSDTTVKVTCTFSQLSATAKTSNIGRNNYNGNWASVSRSLLYQNRDGGLTRVEYYSQNEKNPATFLTVEDYDKDFRLLNARQVNLPAGEAVFGGIYHGEYYNYVLVGRNNLEAEESLDADDVEKLEVATIVQYSADWSAEYSRLKLKVGDIDTLVLATAGGTSWAEAGDYLHIHTSGSMPKSSDGLNHETNLYLTLNQNDMTDWKFIDDSEVFVSHSLQQFVLADSDGSIVTANHGDANPRAFLVTRTAGAAGNPDLFDGETTERLELEQFVTPKDPFDMSSVNQTDAELGGIVDAGDAYVLAFKNVTARFGLPLDKARTDYQNVYMMRLPKGGTLNADSAEKYKLTDETRWIDAGNSDFPKDGDLYSSTPVLVSTGENTGYVMWTNLRYTTLGSGAFASFGFNEKRVTDQLFILPYDAATTQTFAASMARDPIELKGNLSDCQPIVYNGKVVWYVTGQFKSLKETHGTMSTRAGYETTPVFYVFDGSSLTAYQDGKRVAVPDAFWSNASADPAEPDDPAVKAALQKDAELVENFTKNNILADVWTKAQFQSAMNSLMKQNADPATGEQTKADVWYYEIKDDHIDIQLTLSRSGQQLKIDKLLTVGIPSTRTAYPSTQTVDLDGKKVTFQMYALKDANGNPTNYVKVRDLAMELNGTKAQFSVDWNGRVNLVTGMAYTSNGSENHTPFSGERAYTVPTNPTNVNGAASDLSAIVLTDDSGGGYTYYQLRDLGRKLGFNVDWSAEKGVFIETDKPYSEK